MTEVFIPFSQEMADKAISGNKLCTSRREIKGMIGDTFKIREKTFKIVDIEKFKLGFITEKFYKIEGVETPFEFIDLWKSLHRGHYNPESEMYVHFFAVVID